MTNQFLDRGELLDPILFDLLSIATPHGTEHTLYPILEKNIARPITFDDFKNVHYIVGDSQIIFSCHLDTVHRNHGEVKLVAEENLIYGYMKNRDDEYEPNVLGADDKLGAWIMINMINAGIPGHYIFHLGEERGCLGSQWILNNTPEILKGKKACIAFDRMNYGDVIAHQMGDRCASVYWTNTLADLLNENGLEYEGDVHGVYTDSASYVKHIPECTNISVGYFDQHSRYEHFDYKFLQEQLMPAILNLDWQFVEEEIENEVV